MQLQCAPRMEESVGFAGFTDKRIVGDESLTLSSPLAFIQNTDGNCVEETELVYRLLLSWLSCHLGKIFIINVVKQGHHSVLTSNLFRVSKTTVKLIDLTT